MPQPTINIFIPTYNPIAVQLQQAIDSVLAQTCEDWTLLIHDDASSKDPFPIVEPYLKDARITFRRSTKRLGIAGNWNACMALANAPFVQLLFQDDVWHAQYLEKSLNALKTNLGIVFTAANHRYKDELENAAFGMYDTLYHHKNECMRDGVHNGHEFLMQWIENGLRPNLIGEPSFVMIRTATAKACGPYADNLAQCLDLEYWTRLLQKGDLYYLAEELGSFRVHSKGASAQNDLSGVGMFDRLLCFEKLIKTLPDATDRKQTQKALKKNVLTMIDKFFHRAKSNAAGATGAAKKIPLRFYPLLIGGLGRYVMKGK